jgi:hypothetical protein
LKNEHWRRSEDNPNQEANKAKRCGANRTVVLPTVGGTESRAQNNNRAHPDYLGCDPKNSEQ